MRGHYFASYTIINWATSTHLFWDALFRLFWSYLSNWRKSNLSHDFWDQPYLRKAESLHWEANSSSCIWAYGTDTDRATAYATATAITRAITRELLLMRLIQLMLKPKPWPHQFPRLLGLYISYPLTKEFSASTEYRSSTVLFHAITFYGWPSSHLTNPMYMMRGVI